MVIYFNKFNSNFWPSKFISYRFLFHIKLTSFFLKECFIYLFLATPHDMWDLSSPARDQTHAPCNGSMESQPLDLQGSPTFSFYY